MSDSSHWADEAASRTIAVHPDADVYVVAAGITPSGVVHVGNFREIITVDLVARALRDRGCRVRFLYSWDDFDVFRRVPVDAPQQAMLEANLRKSIACVPDPYEDGHDSYAGHYIAQLEAEIAPLGIAPEFIRQAARYRSGTYAAGIRRALEHAPAIRAILDRHRTTPLPETWLPLAGFCGACGRDDLRFTWPDPRGEEPAWTVGYACGGCDHTEAVDLRRGGRIKLPWRVDWPMRWAYEGVLFEPGGKDHSVAGGSYDTAREIVAEVYEKKSPQYTRYDWVRVKGRGGKISSSAGDAITVAQCLEVYESEMLRWIFASYRASSEMQISFDLDVIKLYEDFDRMHRVAREPATGSRADAKRDAARRILQLASVDHRPIAPGDPVPFRAPVRHLSILLQVYDGDLPRTREHYEREGKLSNEAERTAFLVRAQCIWTWITQHAPEEFRYRIRSEPVVRALDPDQRVVLSRLAGALASHPDIVEDTVIGYLKTMCEGTSLTPQTFFPVAYDLLIDRERGPKLSTLITTMGAARAHALLAPSLKAGA
jgi:lysyl-tRNA synthetase class 1